MVPFITPALPSLSSYYSTCHKPKTRTTSYQPTMSNLISTPLLLGGGGGEYNCNDEYNNKYNNVEGRGHAGE
jgi:hypothetical protein